MSFIEISIPCNEELQEILIAELALFEEYDSFCQEDSRMMAYIEESSFDEVKFKVVLTKYNLSAFEIEKMKDKNWNEEWEKNFDPIIVDDQILIKADFHKKEKTYPLEVLINPRMAFGTGHHPTTYLVSSAMLNLDLKDKKIVDIGCGTGVLAIIAEKLGGNELLAFDNNPWAFDNAVENVGANYCKNIDVKQASIEELNIDKNTYDIALANINRNVILEQLSEYKNVTKQGGTIVLSGILADDESIIKDHASELQLQYKSTLKKDKWVAIVYEV